MANTKGEKELKRKWPHATGLDSDSKHEGRTRNLIAKGLNGVKSIVYEREYIGL